MSTELNIDVNKRPISIAKADALARARQQAVTARKGKQLERLQRKVQELKGVLQDVPAPNVEKIGELLVAGEEKRTTLLNDINNALQTIHSMLSQRVAPVARPTTPRRQPPEDTRSEISSAPSSSSNNDLYEAVMRRMSAAAARSPHKKMRR